MKTNKTLERIIFAVLVSILLALFVVCCCKTQYGHEWTEMYRDDNIVVERCTKCGEERFFNAY
jgi:hypothetical protein